MRYSYNKTLSGMDPLLFSSCFPTPATDNISLVNNLCSSSQGGHHGFFTRLCGIMNMPLVDGMRLP